LPTKQDHNALSLGRDETEQKDILSAAIVAFRGSVAQWRFGMESYFLVARSYQMEDDVGRRQERARIAEPEMPRQDERCETASILAYSG
jgi:hypothetical protein